MLHHCYNCWQVQYRYLYQVAQHWLCDMNVYTNTSWTSLHWTFYNMNSRTKAIWRLRNGQTFKVTLVHPECFLSWRWKHYSANTSLVIVSSQYFWHFWFVYYLVYNISKTCPMCYIDEEDELRCLLPCPCLTELRKSFISKIYCIRPNNFKLPMLM